MQCDNLSDSVVHSDIEYFQRLADGAPVMIWMSGSDMGCFYFNRAWLEFRGRTLQQEFGNGWAEGVHPEDMERCVQHYINCFQRRVPFAMSYRLQHHTGEYRWILDRGAPHWSADGEFLGFYGGCAETPAEAAVERIAQLREALHQMREFADCLAETEAYAARHDTSGGDTHEAEGRRLHLEQRLRQNAAVQFGKLAADMLAYDRIANGACLH
jgi:PAS domain S-box-containing protein